MCFESLKLLHQFVRTSIGKNKLFAVLNVTGNSLHLRLRGRHGVTQFAGFFDESNDRGTVFRRESEIVDQANGERLRSGELRYGATHVACQLNGIFSRKGRCRCRRGAHRTGFAARIDQPFYFLVIIPGNFRYAGCLSGFNHFHHFAVGILDGEKQEWCLLLFLSAKISVGRIGGIGTVLACFSLAFLADLLEGLNVILYIISKSDSVSRVGCAEIGMTLAVFPAGLAEHDAFLDRIDGCILVEIGRNEIPQQGIVVEDEKSSAEAGQDQIVLTLLDGDIIYAGGGQAGLQLNPFLAAIEGDPESKFSTHEKQVLLDCILLDSMNHSVFRQVGR